MDYNKVDTMKEHLITKLAKFLIEILFQEIKKLCPRFSSDKKEFGNMSLTK